MSNKFEFDIAEFNKKFEQVMDERKKETENEEKNKLKKLESETEKKKTPYNQTIGEILIGIKDTFIDIVHDILNGEFDSDLLLKKHRLYYIGISILLIVVIYSILNILDQLYSI